MKKDSKVITSKGPGARNSIPIETYIRNISHMFIIAEIKGTNGGIARLLNSSICRLLPAIHYFIPTRISRTLRLPNTSPRLPMAGPKPSGREIELVLTRTESYTATVMGDLST